MFKLLLVTAFSKVTAHSSQVVPDEDSKEEGAFAMKLYEVGGETFWNWSYLTFLQDGGLVGSCIVMLMLLRFGL